MDDLKEFQSENAYGTYRVRDGIVQIYLNKELIIDVEAAKKIEAHRIQLVGGEVYPTLIFVPDSYLLFENEAFHYFGSEEGLISCMSKALVIQGTLRKLLVNFKLSFSSTSVPFRVFNKKSNAKLWLFDFVKVGLSEDWIED